MTKKRDEVAHYVTLGLMIGLSWPEARRIAKEIVAEKRRKAFLRSSPK